jgi:hypothetical protein
MFLDWASPGKTPKSRVWLLMGRNSHAPPNSDEPKSSVVLLSGRPTPVPFFPPMQSFMICTASVNATYGKGEQAQARKLVISIIIVLYRKIHTDGNAATSL